MEINNGNAYSMTGFVDFTSCFGDYDLVWTICGCFIFVGTIISYQPQNAAIISARSSFGINLFMVFVTNIGQGLVFFNIIALHAPDFIGLFQVSSMDPQHKIKVLATFLTVLNMTMDWYTYKFVFMLSFIFVDLKPREKRDKKKIKVDKFLSRTLFTISTIFEILTLCVYFFIVCFYGFNSQLMRSFAKITSIISSFAFSVQYIPQMATTCILKDRGSYSLVTLTILLVGTTVNFCFLTFGQKENWTTILPVGVTIAEQAVLFIICIYIMIQKKRSNKYELFTNESSYTNSKASISTPRTGSNLSESPQAEEDNNESTKSALDPNENIEKEKKERMIFHILH